MPGSRHWSLIARQVSGLPLPPPPHPHPEDSDSKSLRWAQPSLFCISSNNPWVIWMHG